MEKPLVSIYATVYNNANIVSKSIKSIINQFPDFDKNFEFVIVDNYSNDGTYEILLKFQKKHPNIKIIRANCTRGGGRAIAVNKSQGNYLFYVDLDTIYTPVLSKVIYKMIKEYKTGSLMPYGFCDRKTMNKIGNWNYNLNTGEDWEFSARAISKGVKLFDLPAILGLNEVVNSRSRERRYYKNMISYIIRRYKNLEDTIRGKGFLKIDSKVKADISNLRYLAYLLIYFKIKILRQKIYSYYDKGPNSIFIYKNIKLLNPASFNIPKKFYFYRFNMSDIEISDLNRHLETLRNFGFNKIELNEPKLNRLRLFVYTDKTDKNLLNLLRYT
ncbi:MAG: glycosyltransferase family 2 protein [Candidatus Rehaiarchaeum fermentans]|nr:glycosyltransferase [Candidatus Rehaiarchaeum fermentans]